MKNVSQKAQVFAYNYSTGAPVTGDSANWTVRGTQDGTEFTPASPSVTEIDSTNYKGLYNVTIGATENTGDLMTCGGVSSTSNVVLVPARWSNLAPGVARSGVAQAGASTTITLDSAASATNSLYNGLQVSILSGTGAGQSGRIITGYVGSTKVATVTPAWTTNPDSTSVFALVPAAADVETWLLTAVTAATAGVPDTNVKYINSVITTAVTTISAIIGSAQALAFNANNFLKVSLNDILATTLTETAGQLAGGFKKWFNVATPTSTMNEITLVDTVTTTTTATNLTNAPTAGDLTATMKTSVTTAATAATPTAAAVTGSVGSVVGLTASNLDATVSSRLPTSSYTAPDNSDIAAIKNKTDNLPADPASQSAILAKLPAALTTNGNMKSSLLEIISTALTEGATGRLAAAWQKAWNVASSVWTSADVNQTGDAYSIVNDGTVGNSALHTLLSTINTSTGTTIPGLIAALNNISTAQVKAQVVAALSADTYAEPGQGTPPSTTTLALKIGYAYKFMINQIMQSTTEFSVYDTTGSQVDQKASVSDSGTYTRGSITSGP